MAWTKLIMARALLLITLLAASLPVGLPLSPFARECGDIVDEGAVAEKKSYKDIHIMAFIPCTQPNGKQFDLCYWADDIPILAMALDQINSDPYLLPGYQLVLDIVKSGVRLIYVAIGACNKWYAGCVEGAKIKV